MAKEIPGKELKTVAKEFNILLKKLGEEQIKVAGTGLKKEDVVAEFESKVKEFIDADRTSELPESVIDFYNEYMTDDDGDDGEDEGGEEGGEPTEKKETPPKSKKKAPAKGKTSAKGKTPAKTTPEKEDKTKKTAKKPSGTAKSMGLMEFTVKAYLEGTTDIEKLCAEIKKKYPDSNPKKSVTHVCNIMKHVVKYVKN